MREINMNEFLEICRQDYEFVRHIRYWTGSYKLGFGEKIYLIRFKDGKIDGFEENVSEDSPATCWTVGPLETWEEMLKPVPKPGYNSFRPAMFYHDMKLSQGDAVIQFPMLNRFLVLLRAYYNGGEE